jgi:hypothetical protein
MKLNPCRCGARPTLHTADTTDDGPSNYYRCKPCGLRSGIFFKVEDAAKSWNELNPLPDPNSRARKNLERKKGELIYA